MAEDNLCTGRIARVVSGLEEHRRTVQKGIGDIGGLISSYREDVISLEYPAWIARTS